MKFIILSGFLLIFAGCTKVADWATPVAPETEQTGDPVYDNQNEVQLLLPWTWIL
jgi:hypothetical protein